MNVIMYFLSASMSLSLVSAGEGTCPKIKIIIKIFRNINSKNISFSPLSLSLTCLGASNNRSILPV